MDIWHWLLASALLLTVLILIIIKIRSNRNKPTKPHIALIDLYGLIMDQEPKGGPLSSSRNIVSNIGLIPTLKKVAKNSQAKALVLDINSPGGSPVASSEIAEVIWRIRNGFYKNTTPKTNKIELIVSQNNDSSTKSANQQTGSTVEGSSNKESQSIEISEKADGESKSPNEALSEKHKNNENTNLKKDSKKDTPIPVYAFIRGTGASGAYLIASACDYIYANPASIIGSIGVISQRFGFPELLKKYQIEDRTQTAGTNKNMLSPFKEETEEDRQHLQSILDTDHEIFKDYVLKGRKNRITDADEALFSGKFWTARQALDFGLIDAEADLDTLEEQINADLGYKDKRKISYYQYQKPAKKGLVINFQTAADFPHEIIDSFFRKISNLTYSRY